MSHLIPLLFSWKAGNRAGRLPHRDQKTNCRNSSRPAPQAEGPPRWNSRLRWNIRLGGTQDFPKMLQTAKPRFQTKNECTPETRSKIDRCLWRKKGEPMIARAQSCSLGPHGSVSVCATLCQFFSFPSPVCVHLRNLRFQLRQHKNRANALCVFARGKTVFRTFLWGVFFFKHRVFKVCGKRFCGLRQAASISLRKIPGLR